jgi:hypothetical protein
VPRALAAVPDLDQELDRLYALAPEEFTSARNDLAARLRKAGQAEAAEQVRALRKPSVPVWAVNQLARRHPDEVGQLISAGAQLRRAQEEAFRAERGGETVREATAAERAAVRTLTRRAQSLLQEEGRGATHAALERIASTLRSAAVEPDAAPLLAAGRLAAEVGSTGFLTAAELAPPPPKKRTTDAAERRRERELKKLRARVERLERRADDEEEKAGLAEQTALKARELAKAAREEAAAARAELDKLASMS